MKTASKCANKTEKKLIDSLKEQSKLIDAIQSSYKEKLVATRDSLHEMIKKIEQSVDEKCEQMKKPIKESTLQFTQQIEMLRTDTEKQLHEVCGMVEDIGKMNHRTETVLQQKVPVIDSLYVSLTNLQRKLDEVT